MLRCKNVIMKLHVRTVCLISLVLLAVTCQAAAAAPPPAEDEAAIKSLFDKHIAAFNAGDAAAVAALFTDDGEMIPPDRAPLAGKNMIQWGMNIAFDLFTAKIGETSLQIELAGDSAYARRAYVIAITSTTSGAETEITANWLEILKRQPDGSWKISIEMVNSNHPLPGAEE
jgi:uncharacterized protein (TIGR02246 family)